MSLTVYAFCYYPTWKPSEWGDQKWSQGEWATSKFIKALKGMPVNGYGDVLVLGKWRRLEETNKSDALVWFTEWVAKLLENLKRTGAVFVPVPSSQTTLQSKTPCRTATIAGAIASKLGTQFAVADVVRFRKKQKPAHQGGPRFPDEVFPLLTVVPSWKPSNARPHVLLDDVVTSGGHLRAWAALLAQRGVVPPMAVCAGRTSDQPVTNAFAVPVETLSDYEP